MPENNKRQFLAFEQPIKILVDEIEKIKSSQKKTSVDLTGLIQTMEEKVIAKRKEITQSLSGWERVLLSRHPDRPYTLKYIEKMTKNFIQLHGDRSFGDDKAIIGGFATIDEETVMMIGHQKGINTKSRQMRNFGMANPWGYRKALR